MNRKTQARSLMVLMIAIGTPASAEEIALPAHSSIRNLVKKIIPSGRTESSGYWTRRHAPQVVEEGWRQFDKKSYQSALKTFLLAISMDDTNASAYFGVGYVCSVRNDIPDAIVFYRKALKYEQKYSPIYANLAKALLIYHDKSQEPQILLDKAIEVDPKNSDAYYTYAGYFAEKGMWTKADEMAKKARDCGATLDPHFLNELRKHTSSHGLTRIDC